MTFQQQNPSLLAQAIADNVRYFSGGRWRRHSRPIPISEFRVPPLFFGICVASAPEEACDDYIVARLQELGITCVRVDFTYASRDDYGERFLERLLDEPFQVCLHLVQPLSEVKAMGDPQAQDRWRSFVSETLDAYGAQLEMIEIGSTCNRRKWSGYTPATFLLSWQIAWEEAQRHHIRLAGPNVTDFEPFYNVALLSKLKRSGMLPTLHTDNLFVERATEPEVFDHKILGRVLAGALRFNLVRKAQLLNDIGRWTGVSSTACTHVSWSLRRIARMLDHTEEKQADYVARYGCLAAASGALARVYWGPLIGQREGFIDDGTSEYPNIPHVTFYGRAHGQITHYRHRPAFYAFQTVNRFISGALFKRKVPTGSGLEILEFVAPATKAFYPPITQNKKIPNPLRQSAKSGDDHPPVGQPSSSEHILHVVWTTNGNNAEALACYPLETLHTATAYSRDGAKLSHAPTLFSESPVYLFWPATASIRVKATAGIIQGVRFAHRPGQAFAPICHQDWTGFYLAEDSGMTIHVPDLLALFSTRSPASTPASNKRRWRGRFTHASAMAKPHATLLNDPSTSDQVVVLRDSRNRVWMVPAPWDNSQALIVKEFKPCCFWRRLLQWHRPNRALRSWNGAQELLRRGISTPLPIAFFHSPYRPSVHRSYFIYRAFKYGWSVREAFTAFSRGATHFQGKPKTDLFEAITQFLQALHNRGVFFRDLSAGNLLFRSEAEADIEFALIDTTRARFYPVGLGLRQRLCDLIRICHPLNWKEREAFVGMYLQFIGRRFHLWMKIPFVYYDAKHWIKNVWKRRRIQNAK